MSFRKEIKFRVSAYEAIKIREDFIRLGMEPLFPERQINSQYFDTLDLRALSESEEGILPRKKFRVRWYDRVTFSLSLEEKTSSLEGRFKTGKKISTENFEQLLRRGFIDKNYGLMRPSAKITYQRKYFKFNGLRITFDHSINYQLKSKIIYKDFETVIEIKAPFSCSDDFLQKIFHTSSTRFSKYARAFLISKN